MPATPWYQVPNGDPHHGRGLERGEPTSFVSNDSVANAHKGTGKGLTGEAEIMAISRVRVPTSDGHKPSCVRCGADPPDARAAHSLMCGRMLQQETLELRCLKCQCAIALAPDLAGTDRPAPPALPAHACGKPGPRPLGPHT